jgi:hypothetical protein
MSEENTQTEAVENTVDAAAVPAALTVQDLVNIRQVIDVASQRGAFRANEFKVVGETYEKLSNFIEAITPPQEEAPAEPVAEGEGE